MNLMLSKARHVTLLAAGAVIVVSTFPFASAETGEQGKSIVPLIDRNHDQLIGRAEYHNFLRGTFFLSDLNKNGTVDRAELSKLAKMNIKEGIIDTFDADNDDALNLHEFQRAFAMDFEAADVNQDGALDAREFNAYFD